MFFRKKPNFSLSVKTSPEDRDELAFSADKLNSVNEGRLSVDVVETETELIILATMAGTLKEKIFLHLDNDMLTIKGEREWPVPREKHFHCHECYWGKFSRTIVLPTDVLLELARAEYRNGLLTVCLPKARPEQNIPIFVVDD